MSFEGLTCSVRTFHARMRKESYVKRQAVPPSWMRCPAGDPMEPRRSPIGETRRPSIDGAARAEGAQAPDVVDDASVAGPAAEPMTAARKTPEGPPLDELRKRLEPAMSTSRGSPTLQINHSASDSGRCPSPLGSSPSPQLGSRPAEGFSWSGPPSSWLPDDASLAPAESQASLASDSSSGPRLLERPSPESLTRSEPTRESTRERPDRCDPLSRSLDRTDPLGRSLDRTDPLGKGDKSSKLLEKKKKTSSWYNMLNPTYKSRSEDFKRLFKDLPETERLIVDYSCALQRDILVHGRLYVTQNFICFYANIFRWETNVVIRCRDVTSMTKEKTARVIPNAVQVCTDHEKHFFTSFGARDKTYLMLFRIWQNALMEQPMSTQELWQWVHYSYGDELGLTSDDDDYVAPPYLEDEARATGLRGVPQLKSQEDPRDVSPFQLGSWQEEENEHSGDPYVGVEPPPTSDDSSDGEECPCPSPCHEGKEALNLVLPMSVDQLFTLLFTGSRFFHDLLTSRKTYDVTESNWQPCPETGHKLRQLTYTVTLNHAMAKAAQTTETQILQKVSKPGQVYAIDCDVQSVGIPYSDAFCVKSHYCLVRLSDRRCRLRVYGCVRYKKSVWGLVKAVIEKNSLQGVAGFCSDLESALLREAERLQPARAQGRRRRLKEPRLDREDRSSSSQAGFPRFGGLRGHHMESRRSCMPVNMTLKALLFLVAIVLLINMALLYKLWVPEGQFFSRSMDIVLLEPSSRDEWVQLLSQREAFRRIEATAWIGAVNDLLRRLRLMEGSLHDLKKSLEAGISSEGRSHAMPEGPAAPEGPVVPEGSAGEIPKSQEL